MKYKLRMESKNRASFDCAVSLQGRSLAHENDVLEGEISEESSEIIIQVKSSECGKAQANFYIEIEDGPPVIFSC